MWDLLSGSIGETPARAVVLDDATGFWHGVSAAEYLAERGTAVELLTPGRMVAQSIPHESVAGVHRRLRGNGVKFRPYTNVKEVNGTAVQLVDTLTGEPGEVLDADLVVVRTNLGVNDQLATDLDRKVASIVCIGDSVSPRRLSHAVADASFALRAFEAGTLTSQHVVPF